MWQAIVGAVAGGLINGITTGIQNSQLANAYKNAAKQVRAAAEKYSGTAADNQMRQAGTTEAGLINKQSMENASSKVGTGKGMSATASAQNAINNIYNANDLSGGYNVGAGRKAGELNAAYNKETADAQRMLNQANVNYKVGQQALQQGWNTLGNAAQTFNNISDERCKEGINNESDLPKSQPSDNISQLETVLYKYIDPSMDGADDREHSGFVAQSLEQIYPDSVETGEDGYKKVNINKLIPHLIDEVKDFGIEPDENEYSDVELSDEDRWQVVEAITALIAQLKRDEEVDDLSKIEKLIR